ncbi:MAG: NADH-quinone oxidoreductase subunit NuoG [Acidimicrobiales bacterium]|nr:NADH-quinone oxidoreductase subunit NuoG [Acidimicrobiales bacterium]
MTATENPESASPETNPGVPFTLNGVEFHANDGELLIDAAKRHGVHIPHFCYHPRMTPVGMCRMCLVEVDTGRGAGLQPSCMLPVTPNMKVNTESEPTTKAQDGVLELLLINHPLDCPVCDKGGECPLQDNAYAFGPGESRFVEEKRHYEKPIPISDLVYLDRERCILCDRCTRFASEVAGDPLIHFIGRGAQTEVNTFPEHEFSSYFSGNTVQICPVGALTAKPYRFAARPWDLSETESTSMVDSTGARVALHSSQDRLVRIQGVDSDATNWGWLSDKERFIYEATDSPERLTEPLVRDGSGDAVPTRWNNAVKQVVEALARPSDPRRIGVIGGARLTLESQYAWAKLLKGLGAVDNIDAQLGDGLPAELVLGLPKATIDSACQPGGVVVLLGPDLKEELPTLYLRLRHAIQFDGVSLVEISPRVTSFGDTVAARLNPLPGATGQIAKALADGMVGTSIGRSSAEELSAAHKLLISDRPVTVILGRGNLAESTDIIASAVASLRRANPNAKFLTALRRGNVHGALEMGLTPGYLPGAQPLSAAVDGWDMAPRSRGLDTAGILKSAVNGTLDTLVLLGADPLTDFPDSKLAAAAFERVGTVISVDTFMTASTGRADVVLPAAMFGEVDGTFLNLEGRISPVQAKVTSPGQTRADWMIAAEVAAAAGGDLGFTTLAELRSDIAANVPGFSDVHWDRTGHGADGPVITGIRSWEPTLTETAPIPPADDYGLRLVVDRKLWDNGTMTLAAASLKGQVGDAVMSVSPADLARLRIPSGNEASVAVGGGDARTVVVMSDPRVPVGAAHVPFHLNGVDASDFLVTGQPVIDIRIQAL